MRSSSCASRSSTSPDPTPDRRLPSGHRRSPPRATVGYSACAPADCFRCCSSSPPSPSARPAASSRRSPTRRSPARSRSVRARPLRRSNPARGEARRARRRRLHGRDGIDGRAAIDAARLERGHDDRRRLGRRPGRGQDGVHRDLRRLPHAQGRRHERQRRARPRQPRAAHGREGREADRERRRRHAGQAADRPGRRERRRVRGVGRRQVDRSAPARRPCCSCRRGSTRAPCARSRWISTARCSTRRSSPRRAPPRRSRAPRPRASPA